MAQEQTIGRKGRLSYSFVKQQARRDKRRQAAEARQRDYDRLTLKQKIERVEARGGSKRELARLLDKARNKAAKQAVDKALKS